MSVFPLLRHDPAREIFIGRVRRVVTMIEIVIIDLEEDRCSFHCYRAKIMLFIGIIRYVECDF